MVVGVGCEKLLTLSGLYSVSLTRGQLRPVSNVITAERAALDTDTSWWNYSHTSDNHSHEEADVPHDPAPPPASSWIRNIVTRTQSWSVSSLHSRWLRSTSHLEVRLRNIQVWNSEHCVKYHSHNYSRVSRLELLKITYYAMLCYFNIYHNYQC